MALGPARQVVLIIEDDDSIREIVRRVLDTEGYVTHTAANGAERWLVLDGALSADHLSESVWSRVSKILDV